MAGVCDICGRKLGFRRFRCQDGVICKECYAVVSNYFTDTIIGKSIDDLRKKYETNKTPINMGEDGFQTTQKVGTFLLLDEERRKFCLPGNPTVGGKYSRPQIYDYDELLRYEFITRPEFSDRDLEVMKYDRRNGKTVESILVRLQLKREGTRDIAVLTAPVKSSGYAFRKAYSMARKLTMALDEIEGN